MTGNTIGNVDLVKQINGAAVYRLIDMQGPISRIQIAELSQLAPASVTKITRVLLERGLVKEVAHQASTGGRRAISLTTECTSFHSLAVRLGRHSIDLGLFDLEGKLLLSADHDVNYHSQESLVATLCAHIEQFLQLATAQINELIAIAITLPGLVQPELGQVEYMPNIVLTESLSLASIITDAFGVPCFIGNDTRAMALAELYFGASKGYHDTLLVSVHNGAGAGIIVNGHVFLGHNRNVGEIGHIQINPLGKRCQCGNFGCLETLVSNSALVAQTRELIHQGFPTNLADTPDLYIENICDAALNGDELAKQVLEKAGENLGQAIAITVNLFNPQQVVISGKITQAKAIIFPAIRRCIENQSLANFHQHLTLVETELFTQRTLSAFALIKRAMRNGVLLQKLLDQ